MTKASKMEEFPGLKICAMDLNLMAHSWHKGVSVMMKGALRINP